MIAKYLPLVPFGSMKSSSQKALATQLANLHSSSQARPFYFFFFFVTLKPRVG